MGLLLLYLHKNYLQVAVLDEKGKVLNNSRVDNNLIKVNEFFDRLHPRSYTKVVMESSGMWYNIYECLERLISHLHLLRLHQQVILVARAVV
jgi:hypothetical protein